MPGVTIGELQADELLTKALGRDDINITVRPCLYEDALEVRAVKRIFGMERVTGMQLSAAGGDAASTELLIKAAQAAAARVDGFQAQEVDQRRAAAKETT